MITMVVCEGILGAVPVVMVVVIVFVIVKATVYVIETGKFWACSYRPFSAS